MNCRGVGVRNHELVMCRGLYDNTATHLRTEMGSEHEILKINFTDLKKRDNSVSRIYINGFKWEDCNGKVVNRSEEWRYSSTHS